MTLPSVKQRVNILLVDDQPARLLSYEAILKDLDQNLVQASSGIEALKRLMQEEFAVILLDVSMPGMDGFETAQMIHQHPRFEKTPIIFVTALHVTDMDRLKGYELGAVDYVYVPVVPEILRSKVAVLVELHCKRRELQELNRTLELANADLTQANSTLQAEKTRELEAANAELEKANRRLQRQIAERERLEQALREADRRKDEFLAILAHELRNPLAPIRNAIQLMRMSSMEATTFTWSRDTIERQVDLLIRLVDDLLDVSRITQGKIKLHKTQLLLADVVSGAIETNRDAIHARRHRLTVVSSSRPLTVEGDLTRLTQVVGNLLSNAAKYTDQDGTITVKLSAEPGAEGGEEAVIRVADTGVGMAAETLPQLFQLFTQIDRTLDRAQGGLGIGLALVRRLVELHGGTVSAHSDGPGKGSEFVVRLPLVRHPAADVEAKTPPREPKARREKLKFLIIDDNVDSAQSMGMLLEASGCSAKTAYGGLEGIESAEQQHPDVVLLDLGMAGIDGFETARRMREKSWGRGVLLIALTGWGQQETRRRSQDAGFDAHLVKPAEIQAILELVQKLLDEKDLEPPARLEVESRPS